MGLGVLNSSSGNAVNGTVVLLDETDNDRIIPRPTPSASPNDPLNWPMWKKNLLTFVLGLCVSLGGILSGLFIVSTAEVAKDYKIPLLKAEKFSSYPFLACGCVCAIVPILARNFGKRPVYLVSAALELASCIWSAAADTYGSQLASRVVAGLGIGAFEAVVLSTIGDLYFVHQRGRPTGFFSAIGLGGVQLAPVVGGYITDKYGWRMQFWILTPFWIISFFLVVFFVPETSFHRPREYETDVIHESRSSSPEAPLGKDKEDVAVHARVASDQSDMDETPRTYAQQLLPIRGIESRDNPVKLFVRLMTCIFYPAVWMAFLANGLFFGWFGAISVVLAQIFTPPPYKYDPTRIGYLSSFCFPGAVVGLLFTHLLSDRIIRLFVRRNSRVYEPEFRLPLMVPSIVCGTISLALFGWYAGVAIPAGHGSWVVLSFIYGILIFAMVAAQGIAYVYLLDSHRDISIEVSIFAIMLRNFFSYGSATFVPLWLERDGIASTFYAIAGIQGGVLFVATIVMYLFGKKLRAFMQLYSPMRLLRVDAIRGI